MIGSLFADSSNDVLAQIGVDSNSDLIRPINEIAQQWADVHAGELISGLEEVTRERVSQLIADGLRQNLSLDDIAGNIQSMYAFSDERADLIAVTETQMANGAGSVEGLRQARDNGLAVQKRWVTDPDPCPECIENAAAGAIDVDAEFPSGADSEPAHPNCRCYTEGVIEGEE